MFVKNAVSSALISLVLAGCASNSENVAAVYVSPIQYEKMSCRQIGEEASRVSSRVAQVAGIQDQQAENDAGATAISLILFWPAVFFIKGDKANSAELGRLKGELEALEQASIRRSCNIEFRAPASEAPASE